MSPIGSGGTLFSGKMKNINSLCDCQSNREEEDEAQDEDQDDNDYYDEGGGVSSNMLLLFATSRSWWHMVAQCGPKSFGGTIHINSHNSPLEIPIFGGSNHHFWNDSR